MIGTKEFENGSNSALADFELQIKNLIEKFENKRFKYNYFNIKDEDLFSKEKFKLNYGKQTIIRHMVFHDKYHRPEVYQKQGTLFIIQALGSVNKTVLFLMSEILFEFLKLRLNEYGAISEHYD